MHQAEDTFRKDTQIPKRSSKDTRKIPERYPKDAPKILQRSSKILQRYPKDTEKIPKRYPKDTKKIPKRYPGYQKTHQLQDTIFSTVFTKIRRAIKNCKLVGLERKMGPPDPLAPCSQKKKPMLHESSVHCGRDRVFCAIAHHHTCRRCPEGVSSFQPRARVHTRGMGGSSTQLSVAYKTTLYKARKPEDARQGALPAGHDDIVLI